jgi:hypothetical protein
MTITTNAPTVRSRDRLFIGGQWVQPSSSQTYAVRSLPGPTSARDTWSRSSCPTGWN